MRIDFGLQSQAIDGNYANYVFEAAGSAISDGSAFFEEIGAVVYAYNENEVNLWYPKTGDYLIYIGGTWGYGAPTQASTTASVTVKVIKATSTSPGFIKLLINLCYKLEILFFVCTLYTVL